MDRIAEMRTLVAVADAASFSEAAQRLGLSPPTVTRSIAALERRLGARLVARTTRSLRLTEAGLQFVEDARRALGEIEAAEQSAAGRHARARGTLRLTAPVLFGEIHLLPLLRAFLDQYPEVQAEALLLDRVVNLVEEGLDVGRHRAARHGGGRARRPGVERRRLRPADARARADRDRVLGPRRRDTPEIVARAARAAAGKTGAPRPIHGCCQA